MSLFGRMAGITDADKAFIESKASENATIFQLRADLAIARGALKQIKEKESHAYIQSDALVIATEALDQLDHKDK